MSLKTYCPKCETEILISTREAASILGSKTSKKKKKSSRENGKGSGKFGVLGGRPRNKEEDKK